MNPLETSSAPTIAAKAEPILDTLLLVARRADALAQRQSRTDRETDRRVWLRAELEIFDVNRQQVDLPADAA